MKQQTLKWMVCLLCLSMGLTACKDKTEIIEEIRPIKTMIVSEQAGGQIIKLSGIVAAVDSSGLSFQVGGQVESVHVDIGDQVEKGMVLAVLDPEPYQLELDGVTAELAKAKDEVTKSEAQFERQKRIFEQGAGTQSHLDVAEYQYKSAKSAVDFQMARLDLAKRNLSKTKLYSPYDGTIAWRSVQPHEEVLAGQKIFEINATGEREVRLAVPETAINRIRSDQAVTLTFPTLPGESTKGRISFVGSAALEANSFPVKVALIDPDKKVKPGMSAEAILVMEDENRKNGYMVPLQALLPASEQNQAYVFVYDSQTSTVKKTLVRFHGMEDKKAIVDEGLTAGDTIALAGVSFLADGMKVKLMKQ
jgi:RND family efflux transporter MFP subunit